MTYFVGEGHEDSEAKLARLKHRGDVPAVREGRLLAGLDRHLVLVRGELRAKQGIREGKSEFKGEAHVLKNLVKVLGVVEGSGHGHDQELGIVKVIKANNHLGHLARLNVYRN